MKGLEPSRPKAHAPKACVSTNSTTSASLLIITDAVPRENSLVAFYIACGMIEKR